MMRKRNLCKYVFLLCLLVITGIGNSYGETITPPSSTTGSIHGNQLMLGVTDDVNKNLTMLRTSLEGYLKVYMATPLSSDSDSVSCKGDIADDAVDSGNSVKVGGLYHSTLADYELGDKGTLQLDKKGALLVNTATNLLAGYYSATTTGLAVAGIPTRVHSIIIGTAGTGSSMQVYDDATAPCNTSNQVGDFNTDTAREITLDLFFTNGVCVVVTATTAPKITFIRQAAN